MDGFRGRDYYTISEFNDGCNFNYWMGAIFGVLGTLGIEGIILWVKGVI